MLLPALLLAIGAYILYTGSRLVLRGALHAAKMLGVSKIAIGFTLIAIGTSLPELVVGILAASKGHSELVLGNIVGSNMANLTLVLGLAAVLRPIRLPRDHFDLDFLTSIGAAALLFLLAFDGVLGRADGTILFLVGLFVLASTLTRKKSIAKVEPYTNGGHPPRRSEIFAVSFEILAGAALLWSGGFLLVRNAVLLAQGIGVSEIVIGVSLVSLGTVMPEIVTAFLASRRREGVVVMGNSLGSAAFNILIVLGIATMIVPIKTHAALWRFDIPALVATSAIVIWIIHTGKKVSTKEGVALLLGYACFIAFTFVQRAGT